MLHMVHCFHLIDFPKGLIRCVTTKGSPIGDFVTRHPRVNDISFIGENTGKPITKKAAMGPLQIELSGDCYFSHLKGSFHFKQWDPGGALWFTVESKLN